MARQLGLGLTGSPEASGKVVPKAASRREHLLAWAKPVAFGIAVSGTIALSARAISPIARPVPDVILALAAGMVIRNLTPAAPVAAGARFVTHYVLRAAIVLLGASFTLQAVANRGGSVLGLVVGLVVFAFLLGLALARLTKLSAVMGILVGAGTAICGASAILVISPLVRAKPSETAYAIATIFTFNLLALLTYPIVGHLLGLHQTTFGTWAGTAVNDTSVVIATGFTYGSAAGAAAVITKLIRTVMLVPLAVMISSFYAMNQEPGSGQHNLTLKAIPWFVVGFMGLAALRTTGALPPSLISLMSALASFGIIMVLASVGLNVDLRSVARIGPMALVVGLALGTLMSIVSLAAILTLNL